MTYLDAFNIDPNAQHDLELLLIFLLGPSGPPPEDILEKAIWELNTPGSNSSEFYHFQSYMLGSEIAYTHLKVRNEQQFTEDIYKSLTSSSQISSEIEMMRIIMQIKYLNKRIAEDKLAQHKLKQKLIDYIQMI